MDIRWMVAKSCTTKRMVESLYPLVICDVAIEAMAIEIVVLPIEHMVIFHSYVNVYQRVINS